MKITAAVSWRKKPHEPFLSGKYSRVHRWVCDGGMTTDISSSPEIVPVPYSDPTLFDPEETFIASISSCHMLFFLSRATLKNIVVESYEDHAEGVLGNDGADRRAVISVVLKPVVSFGTGYHPGIDLVSRLHSEAHALCFLANSLKTQISIQPSVK